MVASLAWLPHGSECSIEPLRFKMGRLERPGVPLVLGLCIGLCLERSFVSWSRTPQRGPGRGLNYHIARQATMVGSQAPFLDEKFKGVVDEEIETMSFSEYKGDNGYVVLFFYPLDFTFVCPTEIIAFSDRFEEFKSRNTQVIGVSVDSEFSHLAWIQMSRDEGGLGGLEYPLVSDFHRELAKAYGVLSPEGVAYRGLFIIDKEGVIQHATVNNMAFGRNVDEVLRVLDAIQYVQGNPDEVCPAGWQPGEKTMRPDFEGKREYFSEA